MSVKDLSAFFKILSGHKTSIILIMSVLIFSSSAIGIQRTLLSIYVNEIDNIFSNYIIVGSAIALSSFAISKATGNLYGGRLSDYKGRKFALILGSFVLIVGSIIMAFIKNIMIFFVGNLFLGFGIGVIFSASTVYLSDIATAEHRAKALSLMELSVYSGTSFGAIMAGLTANSGNVVDPFIYVVFILVLSFFLTPFVKDFSKTIIDNEEKMTFQNQDTKQNLLGLRDKYSPILPDSLIFDKISEKMLGEDEKNKVRINDALNLRRYSPSYLLTYATGMVSRISDTAIILILPLILLTNSFTETQIGIIASTFTIFWVFGIAITGPLSDFIGRKLPLVSGLILEFLGILLLISPIFNRLFITILIGVIVAGTGRGLYFPIPPSIIADQAPPEHRGALLGKYRFILDMGYVVGSIIIVLIIEPFSNLSNLTLVDLFENTFLIVGIILLITAILSAQLMRDSRPGYLQVDDIKSHFILINKSLTSITESFAAYFDDDKKLATKKFEQAKDFERDADQVLSLLIQRTYEESYLAPDAFELVNFSSKLDKSLGHAIRANRKFGQLIKIPSKQMMTTLLEYSLTLEFMGKLMAEIIDLIRIKITIAAKMSYRISLIENLLDEIHLNLWDNLVKDSDDLPALSTVLVKEIFESFEKSSNTMEDASEIIRLISFKHHF